MDLVTQIGVGGIFAVLIVREVLNFLRYWQGRNGNGIQQACFDTSYLRELRGDTERLRLSQHKTNDHLVKIVGKLDLMDIKLTDVKTDLHERWNRQH